MDKAKTSNRYSAEVRSRAVRIGLASEKWRAPDALKGVPWA
jgi:hypothetical protein